MIIITFFVKELNIQLFTDCIVPISPISNKMEICKRMHIDYSCTYDQNKQLIKKLKDTGLVIVRSCFVDDRPHRQASSSTLQSNLEVEVQTEGELMLQ